MKKDISSFKLTRATAKEYFFLNHCRMMWIDLNGNENSKKFRGYSIPEELLYDWTNEWLSLKLNTLNEIGNIGDFLDSSLNDLSTKINLENLIKIISVYDSIKESLPINQRLNLLFNDDYSNFLKRHYYSGLLFISLVNKDYENYNKLEEEVNLILTQNYSKDFSTRFKEKIEFMRKNIYL